MNQSATERWLRPAGATLIVILGLLLLVFSFLGREIREANPSLSHKLLYASAFVENWFYDLRTNKHFTLRTRPLAFEDLADFVACYRPENRHQREPGERFRIYGVDELTARDKASLDVFWLKDDSLDDLENLPPPDVLQQEIIDHLEAALASFREVAAGLPRSQGPE